MTVVFDRPYKFVPPHRGNGWPWLIQKLRLYDPYLRKREGIVSFESRGLEHFQESLSRGDGILLAPNHCRYADPLVMGWPAKQVGTYYYAMASWHLFNGKWFDGYAIRKMGGFSIYREGPDRQSLETAIDVLATADRPLLLFPEGTTNRTNDVLKPLLDGVTFIARSAARRRAKSAPSSPPRDQRKREPRAQRSSRVVLLPVAMKYLCKTDITPWADAQLWKIESSFGWQRRTDLSIHKRTLRLAEGLLSLREIEYLGRCQSGLLSERRDHLISQILEQQEIKLGIVAQSDDVRSRVIAIRTKAANDYFASSSGTDKQVYKAMVVAAELAQDIWSYPDCYLRADQATDTRIVETIQRMQETLYGQADGSIPLHAVIQFDKPIVVPPEKAPRGIPDPLLEQLAMRLSLMLDALSSEATPLERPGAGLRIAE